MLAPISLYSPQQTAALLDHYDALVTQLRIPTIEKHMHEVAVLEPLRRFAVNGEEVARERQKSAPTKDPESEASLLLRTACIGALILLVEALQTHQQRTTEVLQRIEEREAVMSRIIACSNAYDNQGASTAGTSRSGGKKKEKKKAVPTSSPLSLEDAQQHLLLLLQEHQVWTVLVAESIFRWREQLSRPFPFHFRVSATDEAHKETKGDESNAQTADGKPNSESDVGEEGHHSHRSGDNHGAATNENYLVRLLVDCSATARCTLGQSLSLHVDKFPCCSNVDLMRVLRRKQLMQRARLINTGALLRGTGESAGTGPRAITPVNDEAAAATSSASWAASLTNGNEVSGVSGSTLPPAGFLAGPPGRWGRPTGAAAPAAAENRQKSSAVDPYAVPSASLQRTGERNVDQRHGSAAQLSSSRRKKHARLLAAEKMILREEAVQARVDEELWMLASQRNRFVPVLPVPALLSADGDGCGSVSFPMDVEEWPHTISLNTDLCISVATRAFRRHQKRSEECATTTGEEGTERVAKVKPNAKAAADPRKHLETSVQRQPLALLPLKNATGTPPAASKSSPSASSSSVDPSVHASHSPHHRGDGHGGRETSSPLVRRPELAAASSSSSSSSPSALSSSSSNSSDGGSGSGRASASRDLSAEESLELLRRQLLAEHRAKSTAKSESGTEAVG